MKQKQPCRPLTDETNIGRALPQLTGDEAPCAHLCYCARAGLLAENAKLRAVVDELRSMETINRLEAENDRLRTDYNAMRRLALDSDETNDRLRAALRVNAIRYQPELSHDEIDAEIERIVRGDEQSADTLPKLIHVGLDGRPHGGPRNDCPLCQSEGRK